MKAKLRKFIYGIKLKIKMYWKVVLISLIQLSFVLFIGWFFDHLLEMIMIIPCFFYFRGKFEKQYHAKDGWRCTLYTMVVFTVVSAISPNMSISIILIVILTYFINLIFYYVRDYLDIKYPKKKKKNTNRQAIINILGDDKLSEEDITDFCVKLGCPNLGETIYLFLNNTLDDTADILEVDNSTITRRINKFINASKNKKVH